MKKNEMVDWDFIFAVMDEHKENLQRQIKRLDDFKEYLLAQRQKDSDEKI